MTQQDLECNCTRCREYGHRLQNGWKIGEPRLVRIDYEASNGREIFLSFEDENGTLFGLLRMRIQSNGVTGINSQSNSNFAIIRELHIYGFEVPISEHHKRTAQHKGLGKALMREAERIVREEFQLSQLAVLSGVGAREYYRAEFGYQPHGNYMVTQL
jgi:elongator complex protein 3